MTSYNERLVAAREELGYTQTRAAAAMEMRVSSLCALETGRGRVWDKNVGTWSSAARHVADFYGLDPEDLWPAKARRLRRLRERALLLEANSAEPFAADAESLIAPKEEAAVFWAMMKSQLTPIQKKIIDSRMIDDETCSQIGERYGLSGSRIRQIESKGYRKLRGAVMSTPFEREGATREAMARCDALQREWDRQAEAARAAYRLLDNWSTYHAECGRIGVQGFIDGEEVVRSDGIRHVNGRYVDTWRGQKYRLGTADPNFVSWLQEQGMELREQMPIDPRHIAQVNRGYSW